MNPPPVRQRTRQRRKSHYVDETLQKFLLIGIVALEAGLAGGLAWMMFRRLNHIVEDNLYRVHLADAGPILAQLMHEAMIMLEIFAVANLIALLVVDIIWRRHVRSILHRFGLLMDKTYHLDFTADPETGNRHQVLALAETQREKNRIRLAEIREHLSRLEPEMASANRANGMPDALRAVADLLPQSQPRGGLGEDNNVTKWQHQSNKP